MVENTAEQQEDGGAENKLHKVLKADRLTDPCKDRKVKSVKPPPNRPLSIKRVFP